MIQFNKNGFGLAPGVQQVQFGALPPGASAAASVPLSIAAPQLAPSAAPNTLQASTFPTRARIHDEISH